MAIREKLQGTRLAANARNAWKPVDVAGAIDVARQPVEAVKNFYDREKELVFKRLDLEAASLQEQQLANISKATTIDEIPGFVDIFQNDLNTNFQKQKYGKEWLSERGEIYLAGNNLDVQRATENKKKELNSLTLDKTLKTYADTIAASAPDKAQVLADDANKVIDGDIYLTPAEKQKTKDNFTKMYVAGMVNTAPELAVKNLKNPKKFENLTEIERKEYLDQASKMIKARELDNLRLAEKANKLAQSNAEADISRLKIDYLTGRKSAQEILKEENKFRDVAPQKYADLVNFMQKGSGEGKIPSDFDTVQQAYKELGDRTLTVDRLVEMNTPDENGYKKLSDNDYKTLKSRLDALKSGKAADTLSPAEKYSATMRVYSAINRMAANPDAQLADYEEANAAIIDGLEKKAFDAKQADTFFNLVSEPYLQKYQAQIESTGETTGMWWWKKSPLKNFVDGLFGEDMSEDEQKADPKLYEKYMSEKAKNSLPLYSLYYSKLDELAREKGFDGVSGLNDASDSMQKDLNGQALEYLKSNWASNNPLHDDLTKEMSLTGGMDSFNISEAQKYLNLNYAGPDKDRILEEYINNTAGMNGANKRKLMQGLIDRQINNELSLPNFATTEEAKAAFESGMIKKGDKVYVAGVRGTI